MLIEGVFAAVPSPFYPDERIYLRKMEANIARSSRSQLAGMLVLAPGCESVLLNDAESRELLRTAAGAAAPEKVLIAGVGRESVRATLELAQVAAEAGYDAVLVQTPAGCAHLPTPEQALHYFRCVADQSPLPLLVADAQVGALLPVGMIAELARHTQIHGFLDATGDAARIAALVDATKDAPKRTETVTAAFEAVSRRLLAAQPAESVVSPADLATGAALSAAIPSVTLKTRTKEVGFQILCSHEGHLVEALDAGASGGILAFAAFAPEACQEIYLARKEHNLQLARDKQEAIQLPGKRIVHELGAAGIRYACDYNGFYGGHSRKPILPLTAERKAEIEALLASVRL